MSSSWDRSANSLFGVTGCAAGAAARGASLAAAGLASATAGRGGSFAGTGAAAALIGAGAAFTGAGAGAGTAFTGAGAAAFTGAGAAAFTGAGAGAAAFTGAGAGAAAFTGAGAGSGFTAGCAGGVDALGGENKESSFEHSAHTEVPNGLHVSHCPQTIPISCRSFCNVSSRSAQRGTVLDVRRETGQAHAVVRPLVICVALVASVAACQKQGAPEQVADAFVQAYFVRADQQKAKEFTALGATEMLDKELRDVAQIRKDGYTPHEAAGSEIRVHRGEGAPRDQRIRFPYEIVVKMEGSETIRDADVELASIHGTWKVVRLGLKQRPQ